MRRLITADAVETGNGTIGDSILIQDGTILGVGAKADLDIAGATEQAYVGATIIPGLRDAHIHPAPFAALLSGCSLKRANDIQDLQQRLAAYAATVPDGHPVVATRLDDESLAEHRLPTRAELDTAVENRPVVLYRYCGHIAVTNTAALAAARITSDTQSPIGGSIDHDTHGSPTGVLRETAMELLPTSLGWGGDPDDAALISALLRLASVGITSIGAIVACGERPDEQREVALWARVADRLPINVHAITSAETPQHLERTVDSLTDVGPRLRWLGVKRYADGSLGGYTAAMNAPYANDDSLGILRLSEIDTEIAQKSIDLGGMVAIHAIGDRSVDGVLDIFESLTADGADPRALRMEHASVVSPDQIARFAELGIAAVVQPAFLASEHSWVAERVGPERESWLYPFRSLAEAGVLVAGSSDCPVEPPQPLWGMAAAMDRYGINATERLSGPDALALFTSCAASVLREPEPLAIGSPADIVVIDASPATASADEIRNARVIDTFVDGVAVVFDSTSRVWPD